MLAALTNALRVVGKRLEDVRVVVSGAGAAGTAIMKLLLAQGVGDLIAYDRSGALHRGMPDMNPSWQWLAEHTNRDNYAGDLPGAITGADVFIGVSAPNLLDGTDIARMAKDAIVFALANPDPEVDPREARKYAAIVATGRSDQPNQINNVLAFPGVFRGLLDAGARSFTQDMALAAANAIADVVGIDKINAIGDRTQRVRRPGRARRRRRDRSDHQGRQRRGGTGPGLTSLRYAPTAPSMPSRTRSAWPLCRAYSWMRCSITQRSDTYSPHLAW